VPYFEILNIIFDNCHKTIFILLIIVAEIGKKSKSGISTGALVGVVVGAIACAVTLSAIVTLLILRIKMRGYHTVSKRRHGEFCNMN